VRERGWMEGRGFNKKSVKRGVEARKRAKGGGGREGGEVGDLHV